MALSPKVSQDSPHIAPSGKPVKRKTNSPFGAMNMKEARVRGVTARRSEMEERRSSGGRGRSPQQRGKSDPFKALKMQRALSPVPYGRRSAVKERISEVDTFDQFPLLPAVQESINSQALPGLEDITPTPVQRLAIPALLGEDKRRSRQKSTDSDGNTMEQFLLAAETGSGKTLAYLLPTINAIKLAEASDAAVESHERDQDVGRKNKDPLELTPPALSNQPHPTTGRPRAIILVPTSELVSQVGDLTKALSHTVKFRSALVSSAYSGRVIRNRLFSPGGVDIVISTPHLLASIAESDPNILSRVSYLVVDEADSLFDRSFSALTSAILARATPSLQQLILCSATIPRSLDSFLRKRFPDLRRLTTPNLHAIPRRVQLGVVDVEKDPYRGNKNLACADTIWTIGKAAAEHAVLHGEVGKERVEIKRVIVFVNERETAQEVADYLTTKGIDAFALSRDTPEQRQSVILSAFTQNTLKTASLATSRSSSASERTNHVPASRTTSPPKRSLPNTKVLVMTDLGSRGIDTTAVRHVILYDVPHTSIDFIHRLGRTGRMGRRGRGIVLVSKNDRKDVVKEVREGMFKGQALI
ncbi:MAG: RNA helicase [Candelina submexicana]|nr:MAG: RNA helicase [Candelina submexicana]